MTETQAHVLASLERCIRDVGDAKVVFEAVANDHRQCVLVLLLLRALAYENHPELAQLLPTALGSEADPNGRYKQALLDIMTTNVDPKERAYRAFFGWPDDKER